MFSEIIQICIVIPELILYKSFNILATAHLFRADHGNLSLYSLQNAVEQ